MVFTGNDLIEKITKVENHGPNKNLVFIQAKVLLQGCLKWWVWFSWSWCHKISLSMRQIICPPLTSGRAHKREPRNHKSTSPAGMLTSCSVGFAISSALKYKRPKNESCWIPSCVPKATQDTFWPFSGHNWVQQLLYPVHSEVQADNALKGFPDVWTLHCRNSYFFWRIKTLKNLKCLWCRWRKTKHLYCELKPVTSRALETLKSSPVVCPKHHPVLSKGQKRNKRLEISMDSLPTVQLVLSWLQYKTSLHLHVSLEENNNPGLSHKELPLRSKNRSPRFLRL